MTIRGPEDYARNRQNRLDRKRLRNARKRIKVRMVDLAMYGASFYLDNDEEVGLLCYVGGMGAGILYSWEGSHPFLDRLLRENGPGEIKYITIKQAMTLVDMAGGADWSREEA